MTRIDDLFARFPEHLSVEQLAEVLGVTLNTAYRWLQHGYVPAFKVGGGTGGPGSGRASWVILRDEVKDWLVASRVHPEADRDEENGTQAQGQGSEEA